MYEMKRDEQKFCIRDHYQITPLGNMQKGQRMGEKNMSYIEDQTSEWHRVSQDQQKTSRKQ